MAKSKKTKKKEDMEKDKIFIYGLIFLILVFGAFIFGVRYVKLKKETPQIEIREYNGYVFKKYGDIWVTTIKVSDRLKGTETNYEILFHYTPDEVENIPTIKNMRNESVTPNLFLDAKQIYLTFDPDSSGEVKSRILQSGVELAKVISNIYKKSAKSAVTKNVSEIPTAPIITCDDIGPFTRVIYLNIGNETKIFSDHGCIVVQGTDGEELLKSAERLTFELLQIL